VSPEEQQTVEALGLKLAYPHTPSAQSLSELHADSAANFDAEQIPPTQALLMQMLSVVPH